MLQHSSASCKPGSASKWQWLRGLTHIHMHVQMDGKPKDIMPHTHTHTHTRLTALCPELPGWGLVAWHSGRTSVSDWRTFPVLRSTCSWWVTTNVGKPSATLPFLPGWAGTRKAKPIWILLKQETVSGSGISWAICKSAPRSRQITTPAPHRSVFLQAECPSCRPTNSVKALNPTKHCRLIRRLRSVSLLINIV